MQAAPAHLSQASPQPQSSFVKASSQPPSSFVQDNMNNQREKIGSPQPLEIYCGPSSTYLPYMVSSPQDRPASTQFSPNYTMVENGHENGVMKVLPQPSFNGMCLFLILQLMCPLK
ncbi:hypothetical protein TELCIR_18560 [Teladorsagia circumcincta]|uniref:Uncharacterized protein n=1 Tax=Teladorsagia circumcincta TaxID=45464 RepID=A0A2G9TRP1_TELCI|nr:hypothetical protein TELCIR_18560 [Teladorsagia circumcincta]